MPPKILISGKFIGGEADIQHMLTPAEVFFTPAKLRPDIERYALGRAAQPTGRDEGSLRQVLYLGIKGNLQNVWASNSLSI